MHDDVMHNKNIQFETFLRFQFCLIPFSKATFLCKND